ncbi:MAG: hypothetical protein CVT73_14050 [Alphaproteobacteria bacterium HGW-Alphaproteobacteria-12]|nr:MAG: hypothetical protein CVT73_14050 [Alphaproteobacteria bacterium HGW-Alphaproteobacteria-12]
MTMLNRLRLLPTVMLCASLLLVLKLADVATGGGGSFSPTAISIANARAPDEKRDATPDAGEEPSAEQAAGGTDQGDESAAHEAPASATPPDEADPRLSKSEISVLESLAQRRKELDGRAEALDMREKLLSAAEKRVGDRVAELKEIEARIATRIEARDAESQKRMAGVVAMYETMKPKDAARIFERLDMGVLIDVVKRMQPRRMSAVLAAMDPVVAQDLTVELATGGLLETDPAAPPPRALPEAPLDGASLEPSAAAPAATAASRQKAG